MPEIRESLKDILRSNSEAEEISEEFESSLLYRFRNLLYSFGGLANVDRLAQLRISIKLVIFVYSLVGGIFGLLTTLYLDEWPATALYTIWAIYLLTAIFVFLTGQLIPQGIEQFDERIKRLKLVNLSERLAAKTALFDLLPESETDDDENVISKISEKVPDLEKLEREDQLRIRRSMDVKATFDSSRETNINISGLNLTNVEQTKLEDITRHLVTLAEFMFGGKDFSAKLYLRARKLYEESNTEILVAFSKFPLSGSNRYGSSWVKARGDPASVWQCLENSNYIVKPLHGDYYESPFAVCLPGRIGVLAFTGPQRDTFDSNVDKSTAKALAFASRQLVLEALREG